MIADGQISELSGSKIALGTVQFGLNYGISNNAGVVSEIEVKKILDAARAGGIDTLDTAIAYGDSERVLGISGVEDFRCVTKIPAIPSGLSGLEKWMLEHVEGTLSRLKLKSIYGLLLHHSGNLLESHGAEVVRVLEKIKSNGLAEKIGISIYNPPELEYITELMEVDLIQAPLNILDRRLETSGWLRKLKDKHVEVHTRSAFLQGLLLFKREELPPKFQRWAHVWDTWYRILDKNPDAVSLCLSYPASLKEVDKVVVGVESHTQLTEILGSLASDSNNMDWDSVVFPPAEESLINPSLWRDL
jgi:aryl-alcohol dehydrogenase-like predicted oxidoreductase